MSIHTSDVPRAARPRPPNPRHRARYPHQLKPRGTTVCTDCGLVASGGSWRRRPLPPAGAGEGLCPACARIRARDPAGTITLPPEFLEERGELLGLIRNVAEAERGEHPLERLMEVTSDRGGGLVVTTTGVHAARRIAHRLARRFHRRARYRYSDGDGSLRVDWPRG